MVQYKNRYLVMEVFLFNTSKSTSKESEDYATLDRDQLVSTIRDSIHENFGEYGVASFTVNVKYWNPHTKLCILRCPRDECHKIWSAITLITSIDQYPASFNLLDLNGTISGCKSYALKYEKAKFELYRMRKGQDLRPLTIQEENSYLEKIKSLER